MDRDVFDYIDDEDEPAPANRTAVVWNILTVLVVLSAVCVAGLFLVVFLNPQVGINPFPPPTLPVLMVISSPTPTKESVLPPTWTPTVQVSEPTATDTPENNNEPAPEETQPEDENVEEGNPQEVPVVGGGDMPVVLHEGSPNYVPANNVNFNLTCDWMGVVGQVVDIDGASVVGLQVELGGILNSQQVGEPTMITLTGAAKTYGDGGFEFKLADEPIASTQSLWIQIKDVAGLPMSDKFYFDTFADCNQNMVIIYFKQVR